MQGRNREVQGRNAGHRVQAEEFTLLESKTVDHQADTDRQMPQLILGAFCERFAGESNPYFVNGFPGDNVSKVLQGPEPRQGKVTHRLPVFDPVIDITHHLQAGPGGMIQLPANGNSHLVQADQDDTALRPAASTHPFQHQGQQTPGGQHE